jgi:hypothetical protein
MIIVQELISSWGKNLRSSGELRRVIPSTLPIIWNEKKTAGNFTTVHHTVEFRGEDEFVPSHAKVDIDDDQGPGPELFHSGAISIRLREGEPLSLAIKFTWSEEVGAPQRGNRHIVNLEKEQWAQIVYNGRTGFSGTVHTEWRYIQRIVNVAFTDQMDVNLFTSSKPFYRFEELADLF